MDTRNDGFRCSSPILPHSNKALACGKSPFLMSALVIFDIFSVFGHWSDHDVPESPESR